MAECITPAPPNADGHLEHTMALFTCIDGVWWGQLTCRDATLADAGPHGLVDLLNAVFYRPLPEMLGFAGAVQAAERARYGSLVGNMAVPLTQEQNDVLGRIIDRLQVAPTPPPSTHACDGSGTTGTFRSCHDYRRAWLPITNMEASVSTLHRLELSFLLIVGGEDVSGTYFHSEVPMWTWVTGPRAGQPVWNGTCELCCPCCGTGRFL